MIVAIAPWWNVNTLIFLPTVRHVTLYLEEKHSSTKGPDYIGDHPGSAPGSTAAPFLSLQEFDISNRWNAEPAHV